MSDYDEAKEMPLASWGERLVAWLVDLILIGAISFVLRLYLPQFLRPGGPLRPWIGRFPPYSFVFFLTPFWLFTTWTIGGSSSIFLFLYWSVTEGLWGQSLGKKLLGLRVVDLDGNDAGLLKSIVESLGKSFLLPLDIIVSLVIPEGRKRRQRLFNYFSETIVIKITKIPAPEMKA